MGKKEEWPMMKKNRVARREIREGKKLRQSAAGVMREGWEWDVRVKGCLEPWCL